MYMCPEGSKNRGGMCPEGSKGGVFNMSRRVVENSLGSPLPVDKSHTGVGRRRKEAPGTVFSGVDTREKVARDSRGRQGGALVAGMEGLAA